jgi:hypothetical protein
VKAGVNLCLMLWLWELLLLHHRPYVVLFLCIGNRDTCCWLDSNAHCMPSNRNHPPPRGAAAATCCR